MRHARIPGPSPRRQNPVRRHPAAGILLSFTAMKRHAGLHPLSQHHHFALTQALLMRRAAEAPASRRAAAWREAEENFLSFWKKAGEQPFREEEELLLPAYARHTPLEQDPAVVRMLAEHAQIQGQIQQLQTALETSPEAGPPIEEGVSTLARALYDPTPSEENEGVPPLQPTLGRADLQALVRPPPPPPSNDRCGSKTRAVR